MRTKNIVLQGSTDESPCKCLDCLKDHKKKGHETFPAFTVRLAFQFTRKIDEEECDKMLQKMMGVVFSVYL